MIDSLRCTSNCVVILSVPLVGIVAALASPNGLQAQTITRVYSFEELIGGRPDGFAANGGGTYTREDTIGVTHGEYSLKVDIAGSAPGFVGALTDFLPQGVGDPPGIDYVLFDLTIVQPFGPEPHDTGFANVEINMFGKMQTAPTGAGIQVQFPDFEPTENKEPGLYTDVRIDLTNATHPITFEPGAFNDIFGTLGSGPNDLITSGLQFVFNKTSNEQYPLTLYIDNVRVVDLTSDDQPGDHNRDGIVDAADYVAWRKTPGSFGGDQGYEDFFENFGEGGEGGSPVTAGARGTVPEPTSIVLLMAAGVFCGGAARRQATRK
jgi:hypothetical protein